MWIEERTRTVARRAPRDQTGQMKRVQVDSASSSMAAVSAKLLTAFHTGGDLRREATAPLCQELRDLELNITASAATYHDTPLGSLEAAASWYVKTHLLNQDFDAVSAYLQLDGEVPIDVLQRKRMLLQLLPLLEGPRTPLSKVAKMMNLAAKSFDESVLTELVRHPKRLDEWMKMVDNTDDRKKTKHSIFGLKGAKAKSARNPASGNTA